MFNQRAVTTLAALSILAALSACNGSVNSSSSTSAVQPPAEVLPVARDDEAQTRPGTAVSIDVLANDSDEGGPVRLTAFDRTTADGTIVRDENGTSSDQTDDRLVFTPNAGYTGNTSFSYTISSVTGKTDRATVSVEVRDAGQALDDVFTVQQDAQAVTLDVLANDASEMRVTALDQSDSQAGSQFSIASDRSSISYTPPAGYTGPDQFSYTAERTVNGELETDTADVRINVEPAAQPNNACRTDINTRLNAGQGYCYDATMVTSTGINIDFTVFVPHPDQLRANAEATTGSALPPGTPGFAPLLIHGHGYGGSKYSDFSDPETYLDSHIAKLAWESGYFVITFSERGFGNSSGQIGVMAPRKEGFDFVELVNWANAHLRQNFGFDTRSPANIAFNAALPSHTNPNTPPDPLWGVSLLQTDSLTRVSSADAATPEGDIALATIGYSYGGGFQFNAQSVDTRVDAIMPMGTWFDLRFSLHPNDTPKTTWITILSAFTAQGGNGEDPPPVITEANTEANGANSDPNDSPNNKSRQVSVRNARKLGPNGPIGYCDGGELLNPDPGFVAINDSSETEGLAPTPPPNALTQRAARAHLFMIQGYGDTLFNYNEGYDNARCFESQGEPGLDVRYLAETSGHPLPEPLGPAHYAGSGSSMYLDEILHCGSQNGIPKLYVMRETGLQWFNFHLRGLLPDDVNQDSLRNADDIFPRACITQTNTNTALRLKVGAENPAFSGTNTSSTAYQYSREGATFASIADMPRGCSGGAADCAPIAFDTANGVQGGQGTNGFVITGPDPTQQNPGQFLPVYTATDSRVMAGLPLVDMLLTRANPSQDEVFMLGVAIKRCHASSADGDGSGTDCEAGTSPALLHNQVLAIRVFPTAAADAIRGAPTTSIGYPLDDPRNQQSSPPHYPIRWGDNPGFASSNDTVKGRLIGITARLHPGDVVGLIFYGEHPVYKSVSSAAVGQVSITGTLELPLLDPSPAPVNVPSYVEDTGN